MYAPFSPPRPRRSGQLSAGGGRGELPLWAVLVVASGVLVLGLRGASGPGTDGADHGADGDLVVPVLVAGLDQVLEEPDGAGAAMDVAPQDMEAGGAAMRVDASDRSGAHPEGSAALIELSGPGRTIGEPDDMHFEAPCDVWTGLREEGSFQGGIRHGLWTSWRSDGSLRSRGYYVAGLRDGVWDSFSATGALLSEVEYAGGSRNGGWRAYSEGGQLLEEGQYAENAATGPWVKYYSGGQIKERGLFVNGLREGRWEFYDDVGIPTLETGEYRAGIKIQ